MYDLYRHSSVPNHEAVEAWKLGWFQWSTQTKLRTGIKIHRIYWHYLGLSLFLKKFGNMYKGMKQFRAKRTLRKTNTTMIRAWSRAPLTFFGEHLCEVRNTGLFKIEKGNSSKLCRDRQWLGSTTSYLGQKHDLHVTKTSRSSPWTYNGFYCRTGREVFFASQL